MTCRALLVCLAVATVFGGTVHARPPQEPTYTESKARGNEKNGDPITAIGTATVGRERFGLRFTAKRSSREEYSPVIRASLLVFRGTRQIARVALPKNVAVAEKWNDVSLVYLQPKRERGVVVSVRGSDEWLVITFPKGFTGTGFAQVFNPSSSSIAARTFDWGETNKRGYRTITEDYSESDGANGSIVTHLWTGGGFSP